MLFSVSKEHAHLIRIGLIGYGYWGPNLARNIAASRECRLAAIADRSSSRLAVAAEMFPGVALTENGAGLTSDPGIDAIVIATPVRSHFALAMSALRAGKHVFVEKPLTSTSDEASALIEESERRHLVLMVDHTYVFSPAIGAIAETIRNEQLGQLRFWDSTRLNLGLVRSDVNVVWDLASHDLAILDFVLPTPPCALTVAGMIPAGTDTAHLAYLTLNFPGGFLAQIHVSWVSPVKVRRTLVGGSRRTLVYDDENANVLTMHDCELEATGRDARYRRGVVETVRLDASEPLFRAIGHFAECVSHSRRPMVDGEAGLRVVRLLEAAGASLESGGRVVGVDAEGVVV